MDRRMASWSQLGLSCVAGNPSDVGRNRSAAVVDAVCARRRCARRWPIEEQFHDVKEIWGAGQQQVRNVWSSIACWNLNGWLDTLVELSSWEACQTELTDRGDRPRDNPDRRPSHADRRRTIAREMLQKQFRNRSARDHRRHSITITRQVAGYTRHLIA